MVRPIKGDHNEAHVYMDRDLFLQTHKHTYTQREIIKFNVKII